MGSGTDLRSARARVEHFFQSAQVLVAKPFSADGRELPSSVLKYDRQAAVEAEATLMEEHGKDWGATSSRGTGWSAGSEAAAFTAKGAFAVSSPATFLVRPTVVPRRPLASWRCLPIQQVSARPGPRGPGRLGPHVAQGRERAGP